MKVKKLGVKELEKLKYIELLLKDVTSQYVMGGDSRPVYRCMNLYDLEIRDLEKHDLLYLHVISTKIKQSDLKGKVHEIQELLLLLIDEGYSTDQSVIIVNVVYAKLDQIQRRLSILKKMIEYEFDKKEVMRMLQALSLKKD